MLTDHSITEGAEKVRPRQLWEALLTCNEIQRIPSKVLVLVTSVHL